ncbi:MAG: ROK family protein [Anaerolineae bacterium]|nr:ROK family protein [Anaerolineae bacterium]
MITLGIDFGGTSLRAALVDTISGTILHSARQPTPALDGPLAVTQAIASLARDVLAEGKDIQVGGIGCPAYVDLNSGRLLNVPNVPGDWPAFAFRDELTRLVGHPIHPINDVRAITLGEWKFGAGRGATTLACYAIGTGIGGGVVIDGKLHLGISGSAGELGHQVVDPTGQFCNCGTQGCLETVAAGPAIAAAAAQAVIRRKPTLIASLIGGDLNKVTPAVVIQAAHQGDAIAREIFEQAGQYLGFALVNTMVTISPQRILIGGGIGTAAGDLLMDPVRRTIRERSHMVPMDRIQVTTTQLGDNAGVIGAALWAETQIN